MGILCGVVAEGWEVATPGELGVAERAQWERIRSTVPPLESPFLSAAFTMHVGEVRRDARVAVLRGTAAPGEVAGFLPFHSSPTRRGRPIGRKLSNAQGVVIDPAIDWDPPALVRRCGLRSLTIDQLVESQPALSPYVHASAPSPQLELSRGFSAYVNKAQRDGRGGPKGARRQRRRLEKKSELRFVWNERDPAALRTLLSWKSEQYRRTGAFDLTRRRWVVELLERLHASTDPTCAGVLSTLHVGDDLVAVDFGLRSVDHLASWIPAYDRAWSSYSPGNVLLLAVAQAAADDGVQTLDLGRGSEDYKARWATGSAQSSTAFVPSGPAAAGLNTAGRIAWGIARRTRLRKGSEKLRWQLDLG